MFRFHNWLCSNIKMKFNNRFLQIHPSRSMPALALQQQLVKPSHFCDKVSNLSVPSSTYLFETHINLYLHLTYIPCASLQGLLESLSKLFHISKSAHFRTNHSSRNIYLGSSTWNLYSKVSNLATFVTPSSYVKGTFHA